MDARRIRAIAHAYGVRYEVFVAEELDASAGFEAVGYEIELSALARPVLCAWYGTASAGARLGDVLCDLAAHLPSEPCPAVVCNPGPIATVLERDALVEARLRVGLYRHAHVLGHHTPHAEPCVSAARAELEALGVVPRIGPRRAVRSDRHPFLATA
ncbi:MAG: hypothetical protein HY908_00460 [Myxococcales bacterium]|nr:hypothetical protein [Myxococcales bacterium]